MACHTLSIHIASHIICKLYPSIATELCIEDTENAVKNNTVINGCRKYETKRITYDRAKKYAWTTLWGFLQLVGTQASLNASSNPDNKSNAERFNNTIRIVARSLLPIPTCRIHNGIEPLWTPTKQTLLICIERWRRNRTVIRQHYHSFCHNCLKFILSLMPKKGQK